jgi:hypothetical protein
LGLFGEVFVGELDGDGAFPDGRGDALDGPVAVRAVAAWAKTKLVPNSHACSKVRKARSSPLIP